MTFNELVEVTKDMDLASLGVSLGKPANRIESLSCYKDGEEWVMLEVDDRQGAHETRGKEEEIVELVYADIKLRIHVPEDPLPDTLAEFMDSPRDLSKEVFLEKYGAEKIFWLIGRDEETGDWTLHW